MTTQNAMILKAEFEHNIGSGLIIRTSTEQVIDNEEEAKEFGEQANKLVAAFMDGYGGTDE